MNTLQLTFLFLGIITSIFFFLSNVFYGWLIKKASKRVQEVNMMAYFGKPLWEFKKDEITFKLGYLPLNAYLKPYDADEIYNEINEFTRKSIMVQLVIFLVSGLYLYVNQMDFLVGFESLKKMGQFAVESIDYKSFKSFFVAHATSKLTYFFFLLNSFSALMMMYAFFQYVLFKQRILLLIIGTFFSFSILYFFYKMETHISFLQIGIYWVSSLFLSALFLLLSTKLISNK